MKNAKLLEILKMIGTVSVCDWDLRDFLIDNLGKINVIEKEWHDAWKEDHPDMYPLDLDNKDIWCTFHDHMRLEFSIADEGEFVCEATVWESSQTSLAVFGRRELRKKRFTATLWLPTSFVRKIKDSILHKLDYHLEGEYEKKLEKDKEDWINSRKDKILCPEKHQK